MKFSPLDGKWESLKLFSLVMKYLNRLISNHFLCSHFVMIPLGHVVDHLFDCFPSLAECLQCIRFLISTISWAEDSENDQIRAICAVVIEDNPGCECHPDDISQDSFFTIIKIL